MKFIYFDEELDITEEELQELLSKYRHGKTDETN